MLRMMLSIFASGIEGKWATKMNQVSIVAGVDTYRLSTTKFRDNSTDLGSTSFADYAEMHTAGWWTNSRMPAKTTHVQKGILCRKAMSTIPDPQRLSVCPVWGHISIDDIYTGAKKGEITYVMAVLIGDLILVQPDAYAEVAFRVST